MNIYPVDDEPPHEPAKAQSSPLPDYVDDPVKELAQVKLQIEKLKLADMLAKDRVWPPAHLAYEDLPPPSPQERERVIARITAQAQRILEQSAREKREALLRHKDLAP